MAGRGARPSQLVVMLVRVVDLPHASRAIGSDADGAVAVKPDNTTQKSSQSQHSGRRERG